MITEEEKLEIIQRATNLAVEKTLLLIPEVIGNLMASHAVLHKINTAFYNEYPEFKNEKNVVASVVEMVEGNDPLATYEEILKRAVPQIRERILTMKNLDMKNVNSKPDRNFKNLDILEDEKPNPHGKI